MNHKARKRFGQNFLTDERVVQQIVQAIAPLPGDRIIEIGPGQAALTLPLLESGARLQLVEIDRDLAKVLEQRITPFPRASLHIGDALAMDFAELTGGEAFRLVGNLPYNISTPLLFHVLRWSALISDMHFMLQREVVERMCAQPGNKTWGRLSIMCQYHCAVTSLFEVAPQAFNPAPKVHSAIVRLVPHQEPPVKINHMVTFDRLVRQAFSMRRKTLRNCMRGLLEADQIDSVGIDPGLRPESLGLGEFAALANLMAASPPVSTSDRRSTQ